MQNSHSLLLSSSKKLWFLGVQWGPRLGLWGVSRFLGIIVYLDSGMVSYHTSQWGLNPQTFWSHTLHTVQMANSSCDLLIEKYITAFELQESHAFFTFDRAPLMGGEALVELLIYTIQLLSVIPWLNWLQYEHKYLPGTEKFIRVCGCVLS